MARTDTNPVERKDARSARSVDRIKRSLMRILEHKTLGETTIAEVTRDAEVSRTTFYSHYGNLNDVYEELVSDFEQNVQTLSEHFDCVSCRSDCEVVPLCEKIRNAGPYAGVIADPRFVSTWTRLAPSASRQEYFAALQRRGLTQRQAEAVFQFHMTGCIALARSGFGKDASWPEVQRALDAFIAGGMEALRG